jgi:hypothetical protein
MRMSPGCLTIDRLYGKIPVATAEVAQWVEHASENRGVRSSILRLGTKCAEVCGTHDAGVA